MKKAYETLSEALADLKNQGYTLDFNLRDNQLECTRVNLQLGPEEFKIDEVFRFEGDSNPDDASILFAISSDIHKIKGIFLDAYGVYSEQLSLEMIKKFKYRTK